MEFETMLIVLMALAIAGLSWWILSLMDEQRRLSCALDCASEYLTDEQLDRACYAYATALDPVFPTTRRES